MSTCRHERWCTTSGLQSLAPVRHRQRACSDLPRSAVARLVRRRSGWARPMFRQRRCRTTITMANPKQRSSCEAETRVVFQGGVQEVRIATAPGDYISVPPYVLASRRESGLQSSRGDRDCPQHTRGSRGESSRALCTLRESDQRTRSVTDAIASARVLRGGSR